MAFATGSSFLGGMGVHSEVGLEFIKRSNLHQREYQKKILQHEKDFDINLTRISSTEREIQQSMLAYTDKMRTLQRHRYHNKDTIPDTSTLQIRARHIPRSVQLPKLTTSRRIPQKRPSHIKRTNQNNTNRESNSSGSSEDGEVGLVRQTFPPANFSKRGSTSKEQLKMNLASAADLCELAEYRLTRRSQDRGRNAFGINDRDFNTTDLNNNSKHETNKVRTRGDDNKGKNGDISLSSTLSVKEAVSQLDNKTMVKAIVRLRQIDRTLSQSSFKSRKYKKVKFHKPRLVAIPETDSGEEEESRGLSPTIPETSQGIDNSQSTTTHLSQISPLPVIPEADITDDAADKVVLLSVDNDTVKLDVETDGLHTVSSDQGNKESDGSFIDVGKHREINNFERARKQMRQRTRNKKLRFLKTV